MRAPHFTFWLTAVLALVIALVLVWSTNRRTASLGKQWVQVSAPLLGNRTNLGTVTPVVGLWVSNVGPRSVEFFVYWLECRDRRDRTLLATNGFKGLNIRLRPGRSTNLTMKVAPVAVPVEDCFGCCQIYWSQREPPVRSRMDQLGSWWFDLFNVIWHSPWGSGKLAQGEAFASNVEVAEYFRLMYGFTRRGWLEMIAQAEAARAQATNEPSARFGLRGRPAEPTAEERAKDEAWGAFVGFCQTTTNSTRNAKSGVP